MDLLFDDLPTELEVDGTMYPIDYDSQNCLKIVRIFESAELTRSERWELALEYLFEKVPGHPKSEQPPNTESAMKALSSFIDCDEDFKESKDGQVTSFTRDSKYIFSAIEKSHHIKLKQGKLHWWEFVSKLLDLDENCFYRQLILLRQKRNKKEKLSKEEKKFISDNPELFKPFVAVPVVEPEDEFTKRYKVAISKRDG